MANVALSVHQVVQDLRWRGKGINIQSKDRFNTKDTYYVVFSVDQLKSQELFEKEFAKEIIFKSERAWNRNYPSGGNRNVLFIFEMQEDV
jgi:hypothetical protein